MDKLFQLVFVFILLRFSVNAAKKGRNNQAAAVEAVPAEAFNYMIKYGWFKEGVPQDASSGRSALQHMQYFAGLEPTGILDEPTRELLATPRCGNKDNLGANRMMIRSKRYATSAYKWSSDDLTYWFINYSEDLTRSQTRSAIQKALQLWADNSPLSFSEANRESEADITISFVTGDHGDGATNAFDGEGGTLAHAYFPENGRAHFDEAEEFTVNSYSGINLFIVAAHEFGHAMGLGHSNSQGALMYPWYQGYVADYQLPQDDINGIQQMYGLPVITEEAANPGEMPDVSSGPDKPDTCTSEWDAVDTAHDGKVFAYKGQFLWRIKDSGPSKGFPKKITKFYKRAPSNPDAVVTSRINHKTYFFKGNRYWRFTNYVLDANFPKKLKATGLPKSVTSAFVWGGNGKIHVFKGENYWIFDESKDKVRGSTKTVADKWSGIPTAVTAAFQWRNGKTYFFRKDKYFRFDDDTLEREDGYPKSKGLYWMKCGAPPDLPEPIQLAPETQTQQQVPDATRV